VHGHEEIVLVDMAFLRPTSLHSRAHTRRAKNRLCGPTFIPKRRDRLDASFTFAHGNIT
jgi:hypothetical protein